MVHTATLSSRFEVNPVHIECTCGVAGDFPTEQGALGWMQYVHFARVSGIDTFTDLPSPVPPSGPTPDTPTPAVAGVAPTETLGDA